MKVKRFCSALLVICMLITLVPAVSAEETDTVLNQVKVTGIPDDVEGRNTAKPIDLTVPEGVSYITSWKDDQWLDYNGVLEKGNRYCLCIELYAKDGYCFDWDTEIAMNIDDSVPYVESTYAEVFSETDIYIEICYALMDIMPVVEILGITQPAAGELPSVEGLSVPEGADYSIVSAGWYWYDNDNLYTEVTGPFIGGKHYNLEIELDLPEGYMLNYQTEYRIADVEFQSIDGHDNNLTLINFFAPGIPISRLDVEGTPATIQPGQQATVPALTVPEDALYTVEATWEMLLEEEWVTFDGIFQENQVYRLNLQFECNDGYQFDVQEIYVDGVSTYFYGMSVSWLGVEVLYPLTKAITEVELQGLQVPQAGLAVDLSTLTVPEGAPYSIEYAIWYDVDAHEEVTGKFEDKKDYMIDVYLIADEGYHFVKDVPLIVNGQLSEDHLSDLTSVNYWHEESLKEVIEKVDIQGLKEPEVGQSPADIIITAENCEVYTYWEDTQGNEVTQFQANEEYIFYLDIYPAEGYRFSEDTVFTVQGEPLMEELELNSRYAFLVQFYFLGENAPVGDFTEDGFVNNEDVVLLLWNTLFPEEYPLTVSGDLNGDSSVNNEDVVLLLWHTLFPDTYPLN